MSSEWAGIIVVAVMAAIGGAVGYGMLKGEVKALRDTDQLHRGYHEDHYKHSSDDDAHFTKRERDQLTRAIQDLHEEVVSLRKRMYGDAK